MSSSRAASKSKTLEARMDELKQTVEAIDAKQTYLPAIATKNDITDSVPELAVLIVGNDERVASAFANKLRAFIEQELEIETVPLGNLRESENFVDYDDTREEFCDYTREYQSEVILETVDSIWDGMRRSYPAFMRGQLKVGIEIAQGDVNLSKEVHHTAEISIGATKVVDQKITTYYP